ncbi:MAG: alpha/beta hydrolase family protein [Sphingomicrobium sp.]
MKTWILAGAAVAASIDAVAHAQPTRSLADDAGVFGVRESIEAIDLSPDGTKVAYIEPGTGSSAIAYVADVTTRQTKPFLRSTGPEVLRWCRFVTNSRLICRYTGTVDGAVMLIPFARHVAINSDGSRSKEVGQRASAHDGRIRQYDGRIIDWLPGEDGAVLMAREYIPEAGKIGTRVIRTADGLGVDRLDTLSLAVNAVEKPRKSISGYMSDGRGHVRLAIISETTHEGVLSGRTRIDYRLANSRDWKTLSGFSSEQLVPLAIDTTINSLYALKKQNGRYALYRIRLTDPVHEELVASHPRVDIDDVIRSANGQKVIGYSYVDDKQETLYFDPERKALAANLSKALPGLPLIRFVGASQDGTKMLIFAGSDGDPGRYYLFDSTAKRLNELFLARPQLENRRMAAVKPVSVKVADGTVVPAYLTLPPGAEARNLPAVVLPHGGPSARDEWGFDWLAQFLAARGYAVIQPNFRGSAGFGDEWLMENGFKSWRTSIGDITGSIKWLVAQGIADPNRLAVVGWSYGGYAALLAAATEPELFKAVAAIAPVADLQLLKAEREGYSDAQVRADFIGMGPHIQDGSPLRRAGSIKAPVVLVHGDLDMNVGVVHSLKMNSALRSAGTPVELLRYRSLDHDLEDSSARREMLERIGQLLRRTIGD